MNDYKFNIEFSHEDMEKVKKAHGFTSEEFVEHVIERARLELLHMIRLHEPMRDQFKPNELSGNQI